ncbi:MAG: trigger factor [Planctomycetes bacterium]|nr:trigger factor [Planctomycetota bacterium]
MTSSQSTSEDTTPETAEAAPKLDLQVKIDRKSACERHVTITISRADIDRYFDNSFSEMMPKATVPGFRAGRAPRKLVEAKFRKDVADQVKGSLVVDSLGQLSDDQKLTPISEPDFDAEAIVMPDEGPMTFEFDIEVRPEFDLPQWKGLSIERPTRQISDADVDRELRHVLERSGKLVPVDGAAGKGDYLVCNVTFKDGDTEVTKLQEQTLRIRPTLSFRDGNVAGFEKLMKGVKGGETRTGEAELSDDAPNEALRGKKIKAEFEVLEVKRLELPEVTPALLDELGGFADEAALRDAIKDSLTRRVSYEQQQRARQQVLASLTVAADWDLPPSLLDRQSRRELERTVLELRRSGFSDQEIRLRINELTQNSRMSTARSLKEHFVLERIAEEEKIEALPEDYDAEIELIAAQSGESVRRVRAQLEKRGLMDTLRNQVIERKVIELILADAKFKEVPFEFEAPEAEALDEAAGGGEAETTEGTAT